MSILLDRDYLNKLDFADYLERYPDIKEYGMNPVWHYLKYGIRENRLVTPKADTSVIVPIQPESCHKFKIFKLGLKEQNLSIRDSRIHKSDIENASNIYIILLTPENGIVLPEENLKLFSDTFSPGLLWSLIPSGDLAYAHLINYRQQDDRIAIKPFASRDYLAPKDIGLKVDKDESSPLELNVFQTNYQLPESELHEALVANILAGRLGDINLLQFNKIIIDIILQFLPYKKWHAKGLGVDATSIKLAQQLFPDCPLLGKMHRMLDNRYELGQNYDWLAQYYGFDGGRSWGAAHAIHHVWRSCIKPTKRICLLTSARNEGPYILEFIAYYKALGIDGIFIYSNDNDDGSDELLEQLARAGEIFYIKNIQGNVGAQAKSFAHALSLNREILDYEWCLLTDMDEFLWINPEKFNSLNEFIEYHEKLSSDSIFINWVYAGANGRIAYSPENVLLRFPYCHTRPEKTGKTIFKPRLAYAAYCHYPHVIRPSEITRTHSSGVMLNLNPAQNEISCLASSDNLDIGSAIIYHYFTKSFDEFLVKCSRNPGGKQKVDGLDFTRFTYEYFGGFLFHFKSRKARTQFTNENLKNYFTYLHTYLNDKNIRKSQTCIENEFIKKVELTKRSFSDYYLKDARLADKIHIFYEKNNIPITK